MTQLDRSLKSGGAAAPPNCALHYVAEAYDRDSKLIVGRQSAGAGFLEALARYGGLDQMYCISEDRADIASFGSRIAQTGGPAPRPVHLGPQDYEGISDVGCVFHPGPIISESAWWRRFYSERAFSICGITHSVATERVIRGIRDFVVAPTQPWDALICTSHSARDALLWVRDAWNDYLASRDIVVGSSPVEMPIIPLGVHLEPFTRIDDAQRKGRALRDKLGIAEKDVAVLSFGRHDFRSKSHPIALFRAMQLAHLRTPGVTLHLMMVGQAADQFNAMEFRQLAGFCSSVHVHWLDGADTEQAGASWFAADMFVSLSDNVQESFGLTPVEAMAASLPCVVSDWNGYRETVVHNETGILVPTMSAPPGTGIDLADRHARHEIDHFVLIGMTAQSTAVDIDACAVAISDLALDPARRRSLGDAGRRRVEVEYDWRGIIPQYQALWAELAERRHHDPIKGARDHRRSSVHPDYPDPFSMFSKHPSAHLGDDDRIRIADLNADQIIAWLPQTASYHLAKPMLLNPEALSDILHRLDAGDQSVRSLAAHYGTDSIQAIRRTIMWFYKFGLITIERAT